MAPLTPDQIRRRDRIEGVIRLAAPVLSLMLAAGERLSKLVERDDDEYHPPRRTGSSAEPPPHATPDA